MPHPRIKDHFVVSLEQILLDFSGNKDVGALVRRILADLRAVDREGTVRKDNECVGLVGDRFDAFDCLGWQLEGVKPIGRRAFIAEELQAASCRAVFDSTQIKERGKSRFGVSTWPRRCEPGEPCTGEMISSLASVRTSASSNSSRP